MSEEVPASGSVSWWNRTGSEICVLWVLQVSGGTVSDLLAALRSLDSCGAVSVLEAALRDDPEPSGGERTTRCCAAVFCIRCCRGNGSLTCFLSAGESRPAPVQDLKVDVRIDSYVCDSGVELSTA